MVPELEVEVFKRSPFVYLFDKDNIPQFGRAINQREADLQG